MNYRDLSNRDGIRRLTMNIFPGPGPEGGMCKDGYDGWCCTRKFGHDGVHVARGYAIWGEPSANDFQLVEIWATAALEN